MKFWGLNEHFRPQWIWSWLENVFIKVTHHVDSEQKHQSRLTQTDSGQTDQWLFILRLENLRGHLTDQRGFCNINCPPPVYSLAPFPISDCERRLHLPVVSRVYFGGGSLRHFCFLWIGYYAAEHLGRRGLGVKAFSVSVSMCALYSSVCVYASVSYGCFFPARGVEMYAIYVNVPLCAAPRAGCISHLKLRS